MPCASARTASSTSSRGANCSADALYPSFSSATSSFYSCGDRKRGAAGRSGSPPSGTVAIASAAQPGAAGRHHQGPWRSQARRSRAQRVATIGDRGDRKRGAAGRSGSPPSGTVAIASAAQRGATRTLRLWRMAYQALKAPTLFQVTDSVHFVRGSAVNWVLVSDATGVMMIDAGYPGDRQDVLDSLRKLGYDPSDVRAILLTHSHIDHLGSAIWFANQY